jgi:multidrug efflux pump
VSSEDVRAAIQASNANRPKGALEGSGMRLQIYSQANTPTNGRTAADYRGLVVAWRDGAAIRLQDIADVTTASRTSTPSACSTASRR